MADKRITANDPITYNQVNASDVLLVGQTSADKKITLPQTAKYVLGNRTIAGTAATDIPTLGSTGTFTNKTYTSPKINSTASVGATSEQINVLDGITSTTAQLNILHGATVTTAQINYLNTTTGNVQSQLNLKIPQYSTTYPISIPYTKTFTASGTSYNIADTTIITELGLSTLTQCFNGNYLNSTLYQVTGATQCLSVAQEIKLAVTDNGGSNTRIQTISYSGLTSGSVYMANMELKLATRTAGA